ncbi:MAG: tRNA pseudouridine(13) synthase TruD [Methanoregula sp.]|nr:MAG: tRNA pseudouridine(13) synthase TruD [Methanoregula sp.]
MIKSPFPLEKDLGMRWYASDSGGFGGKLRLSAEDFIVGELPLPQMPGTGPYLICRLTKKNWEHQHAIKEIAKHLGISHRRIGWAGTKDRRAVTTQLISIYKVEPESLEHVRLKDITLEAVGRQNTRLSLGDLLGNRFDIMIRECAAEGLEEQVKKISHDTEPGIPNYYGLQRFGGIRPVTHKVGEHILTGDYEGAVLTYIGLAFPLEPENVRLVRTAFLTNRDPQAALRELPVAMGYERAMLQHLHNHPGDYAGALHVLPPKLLSMFVSAFQSYLFNEGLSHRIEEGFSFTEPRTGDRLLFANKKEDIVNAGNAATAAQHISRGRCSIAIFMPGKEQPRPVSESEQYITGLMEERRIGPEQFRHASVFVKTRFDGALRPIALRTEIRASTKNTDVRLQFTLPPGHYATTVAREFMKADPVQMI